MRGRCEALLGAERVECTRRASTRRIGVAMCSECAAAYDAAVRV